MNIKLTNTFHFPADLAYEIVERKGIGHPDTLSDGIAEKLSIEYSKYCLEHFGAVLHHNVDKVAVMGGLVDIDWGNGKMLEPIRVLLNGRMSTKLGDQKIPLEEIQLKATTEYLSKVLPKLDLKKDLRIINEVTAYSKNSRWFNPESLEDVPDHNEPFANDTSVVVGYWPLTPAENLALLLESYFYNKQNDPIFDYIGHDIKIMVVRKESTYDVTMCVPFICKYIPNFEDYQIKVNEVRDNILDISRKFLGEDVNINVIINSQDQRVKNGNIKGLYMTVTGSAIDYGEEGMVGRGNNRRGIIPSLRPCSMEAAWGKNPVYHVGKVLGVVVDFIAKEIAERLDCKAEVWIITNNGDPLFSPGNVIVNVSKSDITEKQVSDIVQELFDKKDWTKRIIYEELLLPRPNNL